MTAPVQGPTVLASWTATVVTALDAGGLDGVALARLAGIDPVVFEQPGARIPLTTSTRLWRLAVAATGDPCFSLRVARLVRPTTFAGLSMGVVSSGSLRQALERLGRFQSLALVGAGATEITGRGDSLAWSYRFGEGPERPCNEAMEAIAASITLAGRFLLDRSLDPVAVHLVRPDPPPESRFEEFFRCPIRYGAPTYRLEFAGTTVDRPVAASSEVIALTADRLARQELSRLPTRAGFAEDTRAAVTALLGQVTPTTATVAERLAVSPRTLQRRLRDEGTTLRRIVAEVQTELARELLVVDRYTVGAVATRVGFNDASAFRRAFKRHTGIRPIDWVQGTADQPSCDDDLHGDNL